MPTESDYRENVLMALKEVRRMLRKPWLGKAPQSAQDQTSPDDMFWEEILRVEIEDVVTAMGQNCVGDKARLESQRLLQAVKEIFTAVGEHLVVEELDKNSAELSFACPRAWCIGSLDAFEAWPGSMLASGRTFWTAGPHVGRVSDVGDICISTGST